MSPNPVSIVSLQRKCFGALQPDFWQWGRGLTRFLIFTAQHTCCYDPSANHLPPVERRTSKPGSSILSHKYCWVQCYSCAHTTRQWRDKTQTHPHYQSLIQLPSVQNYQNHTHTLNSIPVKPAAMPADQHWHTIRWCVVSNETYSMAYVAFS